MRIPALEDGLFAKLLIFDYLYYIFLFGQGREKGREKRVWTSFDRFGRVSTSLDEFGRVWTSFDDFERVSTSLDEFRRD